MLPEEAHHVVVALVQLGLLQVGQRQLLHTPLAVVADGGGAFLSLLGLEVLPRDGRLEEAEPLEVYRGSQAFEALRLATDRSGKQPMAFMLTFGNLAMCRARAQFSCNFFAVAGFKVVDNNRFSTIEEGVKAALEAKADIVVACSADDEYAEAVPQIAEAIGDKAVVVVAGDPECRPELEAKGIMNYINIRCNVLDTLKEYQKMMGIEEL